MFFMSNIIRSTAMVSVLLLGHSYGQNTTTVAPPTPQPNVTITVALSTPQPNVTALPTPQPNVTTTVAPPTTTTTQQIMGMCVTPTTTTTSAPITTVAATTVASNNTGSPVRGRRLSVGDNQADMGGNLRASHSRSLNGWFKCGDDNHCVSERATCEVDADGHGTCTCLLGYSGNECNAVDECATESPCPGGSNCVNMDPPMRFKCACRNEFTPALPDAIPDEPMVPLSYRPIQCIDLDECESSPCHVDATCTNTVGGFECACNDALLGNGITTCEEPEVTIPVTDPPEPGSCLVDTDCQGSNMQCTNSMCECRAGYAQVGPNCQSETHCDAGGRNNDCHKRATCTELDGFPGYSCACIDGWEDAFEGANGRNCRNIPIVDAVPPETDAPPGDSDATTPTNNSGNGVGPHPNRPTVIPPQCLADTNACVVGAGDTCCGTCIPYNITTTVPTTIAATTIASTATATNSSTGCGGRRC